MSRTADVKRWASAAAAAAQPEGLTAAHLLAIVERESGGDPNVVSKTGYRGLLQVGKAVTSDFSKAKGIPSPWPEVLDPNLNLKIGAWYLAWCRRFVSSLGVTGDPWAWAMAVYGWGPGNVRREVRAVRQETGRAPSIDDMARLRPLAGIPNVRPWYRGQVYARDVARWAKETGEAIGAAPVLVASGALSVLAWLGGLAVLTGVGLWLVLRVAR